MMKNKDGSMHDAMHFLAHVFDCTTTEFPPDFSPQKKLSSQERLYTMHCRDSFFVYGGDVGQGGNA